MNKKIHLFGKTIKVSHILLTIIMFGIAFLMIAPFLWVLSASFRTYSEATSLPPKWLPPFFTEMRLGYFKKLFSNTIPFFVFMKNSLKISVIITLGMSLHGAIAGYAYAKFDFPGKNIMFALLMVAMMVPIQVTIVALYKIMTMLGVINTSWAVTLPSIFGASCPGLAGAFGVFMMRQFFMGVPKELNEAAAIDGAGPIRTFISIMLPMAKSTLASLAIIVFTYSWNDYFTTFIMIYMLAGVILIRTRVMNRENLEVISKFVIKLALPVMIFINTVNGVERKTLFHSLSIFLIAGIMYICLFLLSYISGIFFHLHGNHRQLYSAMSVFGNVGFMGIPIVTSIYPENGMLYICVFTIIDQLMLWTAGVRLTSGTDSQKNRFHFAPRFPANLSSFRIHMR